MSTAHTKYYTTQSNRQQQHSHNCTASISQNLKIKSIQVASNKKQRKNVGNMYTTNRLGMFYRSKSVVFNRGSADAGHGFRKIIFKTEGLFFHCNHIV